jgi:hypothetical protein
MLLKNKRQLSPKKASSKKSSSKKGSSKKGSSKKSSRNCNLDQFRNLTDCARSGGYSPDYVKKVAENCGIDTNVYTTKRNRCEQLILLKNKRHVSPRKMSSKKVSSKKSSNDCNLDWFTSERDCIRNTKTVNAQQVEKYAQECGIDTNKHTTRVDRCKQLMVLKKSNRSSPRKASSKKSSTKKSLPRFVYPDEYEDDFVSRFSSEKSNSPESIKTEIEIGSSRPSSRSPLLVGSAPVKRMRSRRGVSRASSAPRIF